MTPELLCLLMFLTACGLLLFGFPVAFTLAGTAVIFAFLGNLVGMFDLSILTAFPQRIFAVMTNEVLVAVPLFVFMGVMLERSKVAEELLDNMGRLFGTLPGGLAYSVTIVGALLAASTGIVGATVVTMGLLSLPTMMRRGYSTSLSCGTIATSGTLGQIIPPSIVLVLLGDQLSHAYQQAQFDMGNFSPDTVSVNDLFAGALLPGLMLVGLYLLYQFIYATLKPNEAPPVPREELIGDDKDFYWHLIGTLFAPLILIIAVLGSILGGLATPTEAAAVGAVGATMLAGYRFDPNALRPIAMAAVSLALLLVLSQLFDLRMQRETIPIKDMVAIGFAIILALQMCWGIWTAFQRAYQKKDDRGDSILVLVMRATLLISAMVFIILVGASMFSLVFRGFGGDEVIENFLANLPGGTLSAIIIVMAVMFVMGFFLDFLEIIFIVVPIVSPILLQMELYPGVPMSPVWLGVMMAVNLQTSFLTPPFGFALFYLRGVAPEIVKTSEIYKGIIPYVMIQIGALMLLWFFPVIATWLPLAIYGP